MAREFFDEVLTSTTPIDSNEGQVCLRVILISTRAEVQARIHELYQRGFAPVHVWSEPQPIPDSDEVLSITTMRGRSTRS